MKLRHLFYSSLTLTCASTALFAAWRAPTADVPVGNWSDGTTWAEGNAPTSTENGDLDKAGSITNVTADTTVSNLNLYSGTLNISSGVFTAKLTATYAGTLNIYGDAEVKTSSAFNSGDFGDLRYITDTEATINVYGNAKVTDSNWGVLIGERTNLQNTVANFYGNSVITTNNGGNGVKIGASRDNATESTATSTLNVFENSTVNATTLYFYRNATLNVYGDATFNVTNKAYIGDSYTKASATVANMNLSGNSKTTLNTYSFIYNGANLTVAENATLTLKQNFLVGTGDNSSADNTTSGHLIFKDNAKFVQNNNTLIMYGKDSTIELHGSNVKVAEGQSYMTKCLGLTSEAEKMGGKLGGTLKWVADAEGISTFVVGYIEYDDVTNETSYAIELDFSKFAPEAGKGTYTFDIIASQNNWNNREAGIMDNYLIAAEAENEDLVKIFKANDADTYKFFVSNNGKTFGVEYTFAGVIPEPSTYAAIFGAIALAFVAYRRRK